MENNNPYYQYEEMEEARQAKQKEWVNPAYSQDMKINDEHCYCQNASCRQRNQLFLREDMIAANGFIFCSPACAEAFAKVEQPFSNLFR